MSARLSWRCANLLLLVLLPCAAPPTLRSQEFTRTEAWRWVRYHGADGLPSDRITALATASDGRIWAGTVAGAAWFDGYRWRVPAGVPHVRISAIEPAPDGSVLVVASGDLYRGDSSGLALVALDSVTPGSVSRAVPVPDGVVVHAAARLWLVRGGATVRFVVPPAAAERVELVRAAPRGGLWMATARALYQWDGTRWSERLRARGEGHSVTDLVEGPAGAGVLYLRFPDARRGVWTWVGAGAPSLAPRESRSQLVAMAASAAGEFATASGYNHISVGRGGNWRALELPVDAASAAALAFGPRGDLWIGTENGVLLYRRNAVRWSYWQHARSDLRNEVADILKARDGSIWLATTNGVEVRDSTGRLRWIREAAGVGLTSVTAIAQDRAGHVWVGSGTRGFGALRFDGRAWRRFGAGDGLGAQRIHRIVPDRRGRLWFLGLGDILFGEYVGRTEPGAFVLEEDSFRAFGTAEGLPSGRVYAFAEGPDSALYFGTAAGLSRLSSGVWTHWNAAKGLRAERVFAVAVDSGGRVWFGHQQQGLGYLDDADRPAYLTEADGLVSDNVWGLAAGAGQSLWVATWHGLAWYRGGQWTTFGVGDGLTNLHLWPVVPAGDLVYLGTQGGGTNVLHVRDLEPAAPAVTPGPAIVEDRRVLLRWQAHAFEGRLRSSGIPTRFRVDGGPWSLWTTAREATLRDVASGDHVVTFEAAGARGPSAPAAQLTFRVPRPVFQRPTVFIPFTLLLAALAAGVWYALKQRRDEAVRRRLLQEQLRQAQKLEAVGQLTSGIAHDLNNVLAVVLAGMQTVRHGLPDADPETSEGMLDVERAAERGAVMIRKLLGFGRRAELVMASTDLAALVEAVVPVVRRLLPATIEIVVTAERPVATVVADAGAVEQILWNLATNARDAMLEGGKLRIAVRAVSIDPADSDRARWLQPGRYVCVAVSDTGSGMDESTRRRMFEPFFTTKPVGAGTGLGMAMTYGLMKQHGGFVNIESAPGRGTTVTLYFPAAAQAPVEAPAPDAAPAAPVPSGRETILVVEDEPALRRMVVRILGKLGYRVLEAADGAAGLRVFEEHRGEVDLVLSDLIMPNMSGRAMYEAMVAGGAAPRIVFSTGYGAHDVADLTGLGGDVTVLRKPWAIEELAGAVRSALDRTGPPAP